MVTIGGRFRHRARYGPNDRLVAVTSDGWLDATGKVRDAGKGETATARSPAPRIESAEGSSRIEHGFEGTYA